MKHFPLILISRSAFPNPGYQVPDESHIVIDRFFPITYPHIVA